MHKLCSLKRVVCLSEPILAEDSTFSTLSLSLTAVVEQLGENAIHHDYLVALLLVLLAESGFCVLPSGAEKDYRSLCWKQINFLKHMQQETVNDLKKLNEDSLAESTDNSSSLSTSNILKCDQNTRLVYIPTNWKSPETGIYEINFVLYKWGNIQSKLIAIPLGDKIILNMFPNIKEKEIYSMVVKTLMYVNTLPFYPSLRYMNLKDLSHRFKDSLATPTRTNILLALGLTSPSLQGLPTELLLKIAAILNEYELDHLRQCCYRFFQLFSKT